MKHSHTAPSSRCRSWLESRFAKAHPIMVAAIQSGCLCAGLASCATVEQRPGVTSVNGAYQRYFAADPQGVLDAAMATYEELGLLIQGRDLNEATARTSQGVTVSIRVSADDRLTRARVRVTPGNDETLSTAILDGIKNRVGPQ